MKKKLITMLLTMGLFSTFVTGCNFEMSFGGTPKTAMDVIERYQKANETANFNMKGDLNLAIGMDADGMSMDVPIDLGFDMDFVDEYVHGDMDMKVSFMGQKIDKSAELYVADGCTYTYDDELEYWTVTDNDFDKDSNSIFSLDLFENAELTVDKKEKTYTVTQSLGELMDSELFEDSVNMSDLVDSMNVDYDELMDAYDDAQVVYVFDKDYNLVSASLSEIRYEDEISQDGYEANVFVEFSFDFEFSNFGEIDVDSVKVPKDVKAEAIEEDGTGFDIGLNSSDENVEVESNEIYDNDPVISQMINDLPTDVIEDNPSSTTVVNPVEGDDMFGSYNGLILGKHASWQDTFGADGWVFANEDGEYTFMSCENSKYDGVEIYVYNKARNNTTSGDILNDGFYGWSCNVAFATNNKPVMTFNGLTWGASLNDIESKYGSPDYMYVGDIWTLYEYSYGEDVVLSFYVYPEEGLQEVDMRVYAF